MNNILLRGLLLLIQLVNEVVLYKNENEEDSFDSYYQHIFLFSPEQTRIKISLTRVERTYGVFYFIDSINRRCMHAYLVM